MRELEFVKRVIERVETLAKSLLPAFLQLNAKYQDMSLTQIEIQVDSEAEIVNLRGRQGRTLESTINEEFTRFIGVGETRAK